MVILITGITSGFGRAMAERLCADGHKVYGTHRKAKDFLPGVIYIRADSCSSEDCEAAVSQVVDAEGRIDVFINNAGMGIGGPLEFCSLEDAERQMDVNWTGMVRYLHYVLPVMRRQGGGKILCFSSIGGLMGLPFQGLYSASKFAIEGFTEALAAEVTRFGIRVCMVEPGDFATGFTGSRKNSQATLDDPDYGPVFKNSLAIIEKEENGGLQPEVLARRIVKLVEMKRPPLRNVVANLEQWLSTVIKRILPGNTMVSILRDYYKS